MISLMVLPAAEVNTASTASSGGKKMIHGLSDTICNTKHSNNYYRDPISPFHLFHGCLMSFPF